MKKNKNGTLKSRLSNVLLYYRTAPHSVTKIAPCVSLNNRKIITLKDKINPLNSRSSDKVGRKIKCFEIGDSVLVLNYKRGDKWLRGVNKDKIGVNIYDVFVNDFNDQNLQHFLITIYIYNHSINVIKHMCKHT